MVSFHAAIFSILPLTVLSLCGVAGVPAAHQVLHNGILVAEDAPGLLSEIPLHKVDSNGFFI